MSTPIQISAWGLTGLAEIQEGHDLAALVVAALPEPLLEGDLLVISSKIISKAEGRAIRSPDREVAVRAETVRVVAERMTPRGLTQIVRSRSGPVMAAAGVDASNVAPGTVLLLPQDADGSARALRAALRDLTGLTRLGVLITDTFGRPWREGQTDVALGAAGVDLLDDLRGATDGYGNALEVTTRALADEIAGLADLVKGKLTGVPVAIVRGLGHLVPAREGPGAASLIRAESGDWFRYGHAEAVRAALGVEPGDEAPVAPVGPDPLADRLSRALFVAGDPTTGVKVTVFDPDLPLSIEVDDTGAGPVAVGVWAQRLATALWAEGVRARCIAEATCARVELEFAG